MDAAMPASRRFFSCRVRTLPLPVRPSRVAEASMRTVLYVGNLRSHADVRGLERLFCRHGAVQAAQVFESPDLFRRRRGFGIVQMGSEAEASAAIAALDGAVACGTV